LYFALYYPSPPSALGRLPATTCPARQAIEAAATLYDDYCRVITPENLLTEESEEVSEQTGPHTSHYCRARAAAAGACYNLEAPLVFLVSMNMSGCRTRVAVGASL